MSSICCPCVELGDELANCPDVPAGALYYPEPAYCPADPDETVYYPCAVCGTWSPEDDTTDGPLVETYSSLGDVQTYRCGGCRNAPAEDSYTRCTECEDGWATPEADVCTSCCPYDELCTSCGLRRGGEPFPAFDMDLCEPCTDRFQRQD